MFRNYFKDWEEKPGYEKEFVSLWSGWLTEENIGLLENVSENEWSRFNIWIRFLAKEFDLVQLDYDRKAQVPISNIDSVLTDYKTSMTKDSSEFIEIGIPALECVISEEWDYTFIIWHLNNGAVEKLSPFIEKAGLKHFNG